MARLISLRPVWLPRGTLSNMVRTIVILFPGGQDCLCSLASFYGCYALLALFSVQYQEGLSLW